MSELQSLDDRLMEMSARMPEDVRENMQSCLAVIREAWRGADYYPDVTEALEVIEENVTTIRSILRAYA
jgi:hypothetical protein